MVPSRGAVLGGPRHAGVRLSTDRLSRSRAGRPRRRLRLGQVHLGRGALPPRGDRLLRRAARGGRQRTARPGRLGGRVRAAGDDRRRPAGPRAVHGGGHPRHRSRTPTAPGWPRAGPPGCPTVAVLLATPEAECRRRNAARDRPVPAPVLAGQLRAVRDIDAALADEGWDVVHAVAVHAPTRRRPRSRAPARGGDRSPYVRGGGGGAPGLALPVGRGPGDLAARGGRGRRRGRLRRARADGPPHPDPAGRPGLGADPRAVGDARAPGGAGHRAAARHAVHAGDASGPPA